MSIKSDPPHVGTRASAPRELATDRASFPENPGSALAFPAQSALNRPSLEGILLLAS